MEQRICQIIIKSVFRSIEQIRKMLISNESEKKQILIKTNDNQIRSMKSKMVSKVKSIVVEYDNGVKLDYIYRIAHCIDLKA
jgi:hypothetical protein